MIRDKLDTFSAAQAITASAASDSVKDLRVARDIARGEPLYLVVEVTTAFTDAADNSTVTPKVQTDDDEAFGSATDQQTLPVLAALSAAGTKKIVLLQPQTTLERYMRLYYTVANGDLSTGAVTAFLASAADLAQVYPKGYTIDS